MCGLFSKSKIIITPILLHNEYKGKVVNKIIILYKTFYDKKLLLFAENNRNLHLIYVHFFARDGNIRINEPKNNSHIY